MKIKVFCTCFLVVLTSVCFAQFSSSNSSNKLKSSFTNIEVGTPVGIRMVQPSSNDAINTKGIFVSYSHTSRIIGTNKVSLNVMGALVLQAINFKLEGTTYVNPNSLPNKSVEYAIGPGLAYLINEDIIIIPYIKYGICLHDNYRNSIHFQFRSKTTTVGLKVAYKRLTTTFEYVPNYDLYKSQTSSKEISMLRIALGIRI